MATVETPSRTRPSAPTPAATAQRILEAARELFAEHGFDAQMEQIASRAGVGVGTVYRHFPNKCDLLEALIQDRFDGLAEAAREGIANPDPVAGLRRRSCATPPASWPATARCPRRCSSGPR